VLWDWRSGQQREIGIPGIRLTYFSGMCDRFTVGSAKNSDFYATDSRAYRWDNRTGVATELTPPGVKYAITIAVSERYTLGVAGDYPLPWPGRPFLLWDNATNATREVITEGYQFTSPTGVDDHFVVGAGRKGESGSGALRWNIDTGQLIDLTPPDAFYADAFDVEGGYTVGRYTHRAQTGNNWRAVLWDPSGRARDLHPAAGYQSSSAQATNGRQTVGSASGVDATLAGGQAFDHAVLWDNTTGTYVDLHAAFGPEFEGSSSIARGIDSQGNICGVLIDNAGRWTVWVLTPIAPR
jgi:hypothetical protein